MTPGQGEPWHLDKRVPLALIGALLMQTAGMGWWASQQAATDRDHEMRLARLEQMDNAMAIEARRMAEMLARLDERMIAQNAILRRMEEALLRHSQPAPARPGQSYP
jgi:hypothetical protein